MDKKEETIEFLGSGGGRFCMITQARATGGFKLVFAGKSFYIDPGPGAIVRCKEFGVNVRDLDGVLVSHVHPDHSTDANIIIEAMTYGGTRNRGVLITSSSLIHEGAQSSTILTPYHLDMVKSAYIFRRGNSLGIDGVMIEALKTKHRDPDAIGFKISGNDKTISYTSDTEYFEGIEDQYMGSDLLIMNVLRPNNDHLKYHLCTEECIKIIKAVKPKAVIIQHFGMKMLEAGPEEQAKIVQEKTGVKTLAAFDGMRYTIEELLSSKNA